METKRYNFRNKNLNVPVKPVSKKKKESVSLRPTVASLRHHGLNNAASLFSRAIDAVSDADNLVLAEIYYENNEFNRSLHVLADLHRSNADAFILFLRNNFKLALFQSVVDAPIPIDVSFLQIQRAIVSLLKGHAYLNLKNFAAAKSALEKALFLDVSVYDALDLLIQHNLISPLECTRLPLTIVSALIDKLPFDQLGDHALFIKHIYRIQANKLSHEEFIASKSYLSSIFNSSHENFDLALFDAKRAFERCNYCLAEKLLSTYFYHSHY
jgi:tetratricopeptide (TPR) repeat protein